MAQLEDGLSVMGDLTLTSEEKSDLKLGEKKNMSGLFCQQCGECLSQCPNNVEIPTLMRGYMYAYGYKNMAWAKGAVEQVDTTRISCSDCSACSVNCAMGFDVKSRILDIARIQSVPDDFIV
jgi:predicted aldo/keto reductase-like oxidoreductase